jgi:Transglycosylase-like domain
MRIAARPTRRRAVTTGRTPTRDDRRAPRAAGRLKSGAVAGLAVVALAIFAAAPAGAQQGPSGGADQGIADAQERADRAASEYLDAFVKSQQIDAEVAETEQSIARLEERVAALRGTAQVHALAAYKRSGTPVVAVLGADAPAMDSARRTVLLDYLNARDDDTAAQLRRARGELEGRQRELNTAQQQQADLVAQLKGEEERLNAELLSAQNKRRAASAAPPLDRLGSSADYVPRPGEHPRHNDPFLVCTRGIESHGNYQAYNASGPYYGAYQFTQGTWNATANNAGRGELVGVDPRNASEYDQDDMAWTLFESRGKAPWGGRC